MRKKMTLSFLVFFATTFSLLFAQSITVSGKVSDVSGNALPGVNIQVKGTNTGTATDFDGNYEISASQGDVLIFSFLGFKTKEASITGTALNVTLEEDTSQLDEVVVTAFGIKKETRELGYSVTQVKAEDLELAGQGNAITALQGRVSGLQINQSSGAAGGGVDILIRGVTSVDPSRSNQPLIIVDGLALNNDTFSGNVLPSIGSNSPSSQEQFSFSNRASDINPEDIESFNVLKGAAATALYGIRAANGAIIITTKKGKQGKAKVSITASTTIRQINTTPDLQKTFREGWQGRVELLYTPETETGFTSVYPSTAFHTWGPRYSDDSVLNPDGNTIDLTNDRYYDPYELFQTGVNTQVNFNISGATDKMDYFFSVGNNSDKGVLPNTDYDKTTFRFKAGYQINDKLSLNSSIAYSKSGGNKANQGDRSVFSSLSFYSPTFPINDYVNPDGTHRNYTPFIDNPRDFLENSVLKDDVNRWIGNVILNWAPKDWINITYAAQVDNYSDQRNRFVPPHLDTALATGGFIVEQDINFTGLESNFLVTLTKDWSEDFGATLTLGNQISDLKTDASTLRGEGLNVSGINGIFNTDNIDGNVIVSQIRNIGVFGELKLDYKNKLFLTVTGRNDWVSTLPKQNRSFFYPSVSLAYDIKDLFGENDFFSFGKLRTSWAEVGKGPVFGKVGRFFVRGDVFPFNGNGGFQISRNAGDINIEPEKTQSFEIGADLRFLKNRLRVDYAYFNSKTTDQIIPLPVAVTSGINELTRNAGDYKTFGHELLISADIIKNDNFTWETILNYSTNEGEITNLPDDFETIEYVSSGFAGVTSEVRAGDKIGTLYGWRWRYENGQRYIGDDGLPRVDFDAGRQKVGNAFPDFIASIGNNLKYKNLSFNFLLEWKEGGDLYDSGRRNAIRNGILALTEFRNETTILEGVMDDGSGGFVPNTQEVLIDQNYYRSSTRYNRASEVIVQDASWVKLRNIGLTYNIKGDILEKLNIDSFSVTASAQNILLWTPFEGFDPEGSQYSSGSNVYGFTGLITPNSESYSFGVKLGF